MTPFGIMGESHECDACIRCAECKWWGHFEINLTLSTGPFLRVSDEEIKDGRKPCGYPGTEWQTDGSDLETLPTFGCVVGERK